MFDISVTSSPIVIDERTNFSTQVCRITPRLIFHNNTSKMIEVKQYGTDEQPRTIERNSRIPIWIKDGSKDIFIVFRPANQNIDYEWSGKIDVNVPSATPVFLFSRQCFSAVVMFGKCPELHALRSYHFALLSSMET